MRRLVLAPITLAVVLSACGGGDGDREEPTPRNALPTAAQPLNATPAAPTAAAALAAIPRGGAAARRLAYANIGRLTELGDALDPDAVRRRVIGDAGGVDGARTAVAVPGATVVDTGDARRILTTDADLRRRLTDTRPEVNAIMPGAQSAAQSCLGDPAAQIMLGPGQLGPDNALGVGVRMSRDAPAGVQVQICWAAHLVRDLHAAERRLERRFGSRGAVIDEVEIGERETLSAVIPADRLRPGEALRLLAAGGELRRLVIGR